jgi:hypothetical protein
MLKTKMENWNVCTRHCLSVCHPKTSSHKYMNATPMAAAPVHHRLNSALMIREAAHENILQSDNGCFSVVY